MEDNQEIIQELLSRKASLTVSDIDGNSPLHIAIELHRIGCELLIVDNVKNNNQERYFPELNCCDQNGMTPIQLAAQIGDLESILILRDYADLNHQDHQGISFFLINRTIVHIAAFYGHVKVLTQFYEFNCDFRQVDHIKHSPFYYSILSDNFDAFLFFIRNEKELHCEEVLHATDNEGLSPLSFACKYQKLHIVDYLLHHCNGYDINERDNSGRSPLHIAATVQNHDLMTLLLKEKGIDINIQDNISFFLFLLIVESVL